MGVERGKEIIKGRYELDWWWGEGIVWGWFIIINWKVVLSVWVLVEVNIIIEGLEKEVERLWDGKRMV